MSDLKSELDNERARDIHSCGPHCQRMECQQRREIERLTKGRDIQKDNAKRWEALAMQYKREIERLQARVEALEGVREDFKQFAAYIAVKGQYDIFRKTEEYAAFFDNLAATEQEGET